MGRVAMRMNPENWPTPAAMLVMIYFPSLEVFIQYECLGEAERIGTLRSDDGGAGIGCVRFVDGESPEHEENTVIVNGRLCRAQAYELYCNCLSFIAIPIE